MLRLREYHRPESIAEAVALLRRQDVRTVPLAGGSWLVPRLRPDVADSLADQVDAVVDLSGLALSYIRRQPSSTEADPNGAELCLGATTPLAELVKHADCQQLAGGLLAQASRREGPVNLLNVATVGGCVAAAGGESELLLALLALAARVVIHDGQERQVGLAELVTDRAAVLSRGLIIEVRIPWPASPLGGGLARVARTPADYPIVTAVAVADAEQIRVALGGVAPQPLLLQLSHPDQTEAALEEALTTAPLLDDFRGSAEYRRAMALVMARRAVEQARR